MATMPHHQREGSVVRHRRHRGPVERDRRFSGPSQKRWGSPQAPDDLLANALRQVRDRIRHRMLLSLFLGARTHRADVTCEHDACA